MKRIMITISSCGIILALFLAGKNIPSQERKHCIDYDYWEVYYNDSLITKSSDSPYYQHQLILRPAAIKEHDSIKISYRACGGSDPAEVPVTWFGEYSKEKGFVQIERLVNCSAFPANKLLALAQDGHRFFSVNYSEFGYNKKKELDMPGNITHPLFYVKVLN